MKNLIILLFIFGCGPEIEIKPENQTPICLWGVPEPYFDDDGNLNPREFITCSPTIHPSLFPGYGYFQHKVVSDCSECN